MARPAESESQPRNKNVGDDVGDVVDLSRVGPLLNQGESRAQHSAVASKTFHMLCAGGVLRRRPLLSGAVVYGVAALVVWWGVWSSGPASQDICPCGDAARFLWYFEWPAYALDHGQWVSREQVQGWLAAELGLLC